jgi:hypothetical protein
LNAIERFAQKYRFAVRKTGMEGRVRKCITQSRGERKELQYLIALDS